MTRWLVSIVIALCACDGTVSVVLERDGVCDPGCHAIEVPDDTGRELLVYRAAACDDSLLARAAVLDALDDDRVHAQSFRGAQGTPIGELAEGRYAFVALVRRAADGCPIGWSGCTELRLDDDVSEVEIVIDERTEGAAIAGCGADRVCVPADGRCE